MTALSKIEGIGKAFSERLKDAGVTSVESLIEVAGSAAGRRDLAQRATVSEKQLLEWVNRADLSRIKGVSSQYADLLEHAGVDSVPELACRNPENLHTKMKDVNQEKQLVRRPPALSNIESWIEHAKSLPKVIFH